MNRFATLSITVALLTLVSSCSSTRNASITNMVATMQVDEPIPGVCDNSNVIAILPIKGNGQVKAQAELTDEQIEQQLNNEVEFLKGKDNYKDKGMVNLIVNCKGDMVRCQIDNKTQSPELDAQIVAVFAKLKKWKAGSIRGQSVDTSVLYSFDIKGGKITL